MLIDAAGESIVRERAILRALCVAEVHRADRLRALSILAKYRFHDPHHQVLFDVLQEVPSATPALLRERLPALLTRRGFPDFDLGFFLSAEEFVNQDLQPKDFMPAIESLDRSDTQNDGRAETSQGGAMLRRRLALIEALAFSALVGAYIWRLQFTHRLSWIIFAAWLTASFLLYRDTPKTLGWRADNLWAATRRAAVVFGALFVAVCCAGFLLGWLHRFPLISLRHLWNYFSFCMLQEVALQSFLTNRLLLALSSRSKAALVSGLIFGALHWPNPVLAPITFVGGAIMAWLFARERNIIPLAAGQAILGMLVWWAFPVAWHHGMRVGPGFYNFRH
jgi:hypothetical protein